MMHGQVRAYFPTMVKKNGTPATSETERNSRDEQIYVFMLNMQGSSQNNQGLGSVSLDCSSLLFNWILVCKDAKYLI